MYFLNAFGRKATKYFFLIFIVLFGCSNLIEEVDLEDLSAEEIYAKAEKSFVSGDNIKAAELFLEIERIHPYSSLAKRALLRNAIALHKEKDYYSSRASAEKFINFYPADKDVPHAHYIIAIGYYDQIDEIGRDQDITYEALKAFRTIIERYPNSDYAKSSALKVELAFDHLAAKQMEIGRYYLQKSHYIAAINRFRIVIEEFPTTSHTPEALHRLVESYLSLGLKKEAMISGAILGHNFKSSIWYNDSYELLGQPDLDSNANRFKGWLGDVYRQVMRGEWI